MTMAFGGAAHSMLFSIEINLSLHLEQHRVGRLVCWLEGGTTRDGAMACKMQYNVEIVVNQRNSLLVHRCLTRSRCFPWHEEGKSWGEGN
jgi:hypothetical protein